MRGLLAACLLLAALLIFAPPAHAVDMNPGDSCAAFAQGVYRPTGGPENPNGALAVCDGNIWQPILRYSSVGNAVMFSSTGLPAAPLHVWGEAIIGNQGLACTAAAEGALRYTSASDIMELCDGSSWIAVNTGLGGLWADNTTHISYQSAHLVKSGQTLPAILADDGTRMFFYPDKSAFRGGEISTTSADNSWADANIGTRSFAFGLDTKASNTNSVALGNKTEAIGNDSFAIGQESIAGPNGNAFAGGWQSVASGTNAFAYGSQSKAQGNDSIALGALTTANALNSYALGREVTVSGSRSMAFGLGNPAGTAPQVSGSSSLGIFMVDQSGYNLTDTQTLALIGGKILIDSDGSSAASKGCIQFNDTSDKLEFSHDCSTYSEFGGGGGTPAGSDRQIQFNSGGVFGASPKLIWDHVNGRLGIGGSPNQTLHVDGRIQGSDYFVGGSAKRIRSVGDHLEFFNAKDDIVLYTSSTERLRVDVTGNVGIGTATPASLLYVSGAITTTDRIKITGTAGLPAPVIP